MILFVKEKCPKCTFIKEKCDLYKITIIDITVLDKEKLAELAWNGCVELSQTMLPILVTDKFERVTNMDDITDLFGAERYVEECEGECKV